MENPPALLVAQCRLTRELKAFDDPRPDLLRVVGILEHERVRGNTFDTESRGTAADSDDELVVG
ncbi:hypothetical protein B8W95_14195, partial [Staphylococcus pasteuri]